MARTFQNKSVMTLFQKSRKSVHITPVEQDENTDSLISHFSELEKTRNTDWYLKGTGKLLIKFLTIVLLCSQNILNCLLTTVDR